MVTVIKADGTIVLTQPTRVYQGSNKTSQVVLIGAFAQNLIPQIAFKLPQSGVWTAFDFMTSADIPTGTGLSAWSYDLPITITQEYGQVDFQIQVEDINGDIVASGLCSFEVERGVPPDTSSIPDLEPLETIKQIIQSIQGDIENGWLMSKGSLPYDSTFEYPLNAIVFDTDSKNMFLSLQANNKGNSLSDSAYWQDLGTYTGLLELINENATNIETINNTLDKAVLFTPQVLTDEEKAQARINIGASASPTDNNYDFLQNKPILNADLNSLLPENAQTNQLYRHTGSAINYKVGMLYLVSNGVWQEYIPTQASQVGAVSVNDVVNTQSDSLTQVYSAKYVQDNFTPRTFVENLYLTRTNTTTADLTNDKPVSNANNYLQLVTTNTTFDFTSSNKIVVTRTIQNKIQLDKQDALKLTLNCSFSRNTTLEFGARIFVNGVQVASNQAFGLTSFNGSSQFDQVSEFVCTIFFDLLTEVTTFDVGEILTIEIFTRQIATQSLTTRILCGVSSGGVDRNSYVNLNFTATSIDTNQIADGAITTAKLADNAVTQEKIDGLIATIQQLNYSSNVTSDIQNQLDEKANITGGNSFSGEQVFSNNIVLKNDIALQGHNNTGSAEDLIKMAENNVIQLGYPNRNTIYRGNLFSPANDNARDLGDSARRWKDVYVAGNLSDGTNSVTVADINKEKVELIYDMSSEDPDINRGYTSGMIGNNYISMDFSKYHTLRVFARLFIGGAITEIKLKDRKVATTTMFASGISLTLPVSFYTLNVMIALEPNLNKFQVSSYSSITFNSNGSVTPEVGSQNNLYYVYRIEGIIK